MKEFFKRYTSAIVAISGGIDSAYTLYLASHYIGANNILAVTVCNEHIFSYEIDLARRIADKLSVAWKPIIIEMSDDFLKNDDDRCYYCKKAILENMFKIKNEENIDVIFDGTNYDDLNDHRPGMKALMEYGVISPLKENKIGKTFIRKEITSTPLNGIKFYNESCIATRLIGMRIDSNLLRKIEKTEDLLRERFEGLRLRVKEKKVTPELKSGAPLKQSDINYIINVYNSLF